MKICGEVKTCLLVGILLLALWLPLALAKPYVVEKDTSGKDLQELEAMLSGEHRGSEYSAGTKELYKQPQSRDDQLAPPYSDIFRNDTFFGDFVRELDGHLAPPQINLTWGERILSGFPYLDQIDDTRNPGKDTSRHYIKPILVKEPEF